MPYATSAIVPHHAEAIKPQLLHHFDLITCGRAFRVPFVVVSIKRLAAISVASQICRDYREMLGQHRSDEIPLHMSLRPAVQQ